MSWLGGSEEARLAADWPPRPGLRLGQFRVETRQFGRAVLTRRSSVSLARFKRYGGSRRAR